METIQPADWGDLLRCQPIILAPCQFVFGVFVGTVLIRLLIAVLREIDAPTNPMPPFPSLCCRIWRGFRLWNHLHPLVLGTLELIAYPVLMAAGAWIVVGGWISLKTVAQWERWKKQRNVFNVFLIGNALVIGFAYVCLRQYVSLCCS